MDIPRKGAARKKLIRRTVLGSGTLIVVLMVTLGLSRLKPAAPEVERATVYIDTVKRGSMLRQVRGLGTLVPEEVLWIPAVTDGRVERVLVKPGATVTADSVLLVLSNPEVALAAVDAEYQVKAAEAQLIDRRVQLQSQRLTQQADLARVQSEHSQARLKADRDEALRKEGLIPEIDLKLSRTTAEELGKRLELERERLAISTESIDAQLAVERAQVDKLKALWKVKLSQLEALKVRAGAAGTVQQVPVEVGQQVAAGTILAKVAQPQRLKAELKIPETQAKDVQHGQKAQIDTRNGVIPGSVSRIDPAVREGSVVVDVRLEGPLPQGARPDLSVDGTVELENLTDIVYVGRPALGQSGSTISLFRLEPDGKAAVRLPVKLGRGSVTTIEVLEGLRPGDQVILSDMTAWDGHDRIRLN
ncbi:MAG: HlyD family efflux transporter periplasmic adaptor subunit [Bryobacterales bacterium]|nr:HlyD family efflux transporter periplasmic adaptor subunit [Bryobacterales bacterium]